MAKSNSREGELFESCNFVFHICNFYYYLYNLQENMGMCAAILDIQDPSKQLSPSDIKSYLASFHRNYLLKDLLGKGSFGHVFRAEHRLTGQVRAAKIIRGKKREEGVEGWVREASFLSNLDHPNIVKVYKTFQQETGYYILTQLLAQNLAQRFSASFPLAETTAASILSQVLSALVCCHSHNIAHLDIKLQNILFQEKYSSNIVKLVDFGLSQLKSNSSGNCSGTLMYMSPEVLSGIKSTKADIWSTGVLMYYLLIGSFPFNGSKQQIIFKIKSGSVSQTQNEKFISQSARVLLKGMLEINPLKRLSASDCLASQWITTFSKSSQALKNSMIRTLQRANERKRASEMKTAVWLLIVNYFIKPQYRRQINKAFKEIDSNGDGQLSIQELETAYSKFSDNPKQDVALLFQKVGSQQTISYTEFIAVAVKKSFILNQENIQKMLKVVRTAGLTVSLEKLQAMFLGSLISEQKAWTSLRLTEEQKTASMSFQQFESLLRSL